jgi:hypothetical protein
MEMSGQLHASGRFSPRKRAPATHWIGGCVGPRTVLDAVVKRKIPRPHRESNLRTPIIVSFIISIKLGADVSGVEIKVAAEKRAIIKTINSNTVFR